MSGGKGKSHGGKAGPKAGEGRTQISHSAKAGLQVSFFFFYLFIIIIFYRFRFRVSFLCLVGWAFGRELVPVLSAPGGVGLVGLLVMQSALQDL